MSQSIAVTQAAQLKVEQKLKITDKSFNVLQKEGSARVMFGTILPDSDDSENLNPIEQRDHYFLKISRDSGDALGDQSKSHWTTQISNLLFYFNVEIVEECSETYAATST